MEHLAGKCPRKTLSAGHRETPSRKAGQKYRWRVLQPFAVKMNLSEIPSS